MRCEQVQCRLPSAVDLLQVAAFAHVNGPEYVCLHVAGRVQDVCFHKSRDE
jgi:hypothetical protein